MAFFNVSFSKNVFKDAFHVVAIDIVEELDEIVVSVLTSIADDAGIKNQIIFMIYSTLEPLIPDITFIWQDQSSFLQIIISSINDTVQHAFKEQEVAHPFRNNDVYLLKWHFYVL